MQGERKRPLHMPPTTDSRRVATAVCAQSSEECHPRPDEREAAFVRGKSLLKVRSVSCLHLAEMFLKGNPAIPGVQISQRGFNCEHVLTQPVRTRVFNLPQVEQFLQ